MYPKSIRVWKKNVEVVQTLDAPPNSGSKIFAIIGSTMNKSVAPKKLVNVKIEGRRNFFNLK